MALEYRETASDGSPGSGNLYSEVVADFPHKGLDFVLMVGVQRVLRAMASLPNFSPGGLLIIDNVNWYLPSDSRAPNSRSWSGGPRFGSWEEVHSLIRNW